MTIVRNFSIIAHIDHGKSTLSDRIMEITGFRQKGELIEQSLDSMQVERDHGITVKAHHVRMAFKWNNEDVVFNLIDTPGHVDFSYEVSRSMAACEGAILLVDATQGVEAQTISHLHEAQKHNLPIIPVLNKIDLPAADIELSGTEIMEILNCSENDILLVSSKDGTGVDELIDTIIEKLPSPHVNMDMPLKAMIFDSHYNLYRGAIPFIRVFDGSVRKGDRVIFHHSGDMHEVSEVGVFEPEMKPVDRLESGHVGYIVCSIKEIDEINIGDTVYLKGENITPFKGYREVKPMVFSGFYPSYSEDYEKLKDSLGKLKLNDASFSFMPENSQALGFGFRCGFLGLLHMKIIQERLENEFDVSIVATMPNVIYKVINTAKNEHAFIDNPALIPDISRDIVVMEPFLKLEIFTPPEYIGPLMKLAQDRRGEQKQVLYIGNKRVLMEYEIPMAEVIFDFFDKLKTLSKGYASMDYQMLDYRPSNLVRLDILVNDMRVDALSAIVHKDKAFFYGNRMARKLKDTIHRQMFEIRVQAAIGSKVISKTVVKALRKNVLAKCYGGDITRKRKLLEKQKAGKKRMKSIGKVEIPQEAFLAALSIDDE